MNNCLSVFVDKKKKEKPTMSPPTASLQKDELYVKRKTTQYRRKNKKKIEG